MQLLVSVRNVHEAQAAFDGGTDVIDAKEPLAGALGRVELSTFGQIVAGVAGRRPVSAALGDLYEEEDARRDAHVFALAGAAFVKAGFAGIGSEARVASLIAAAAAGAADAGSSVVAVAYADHAEAAAPPPDIILRAAIRSGARGVLLDTAAKHGPSLLQLVPAQTLTEWVRRARLGGLSVALAGRVTVEEIPIVVSTGAEIVGVRGAACDGARDGQISVEKVRRLQAALRAQTHHRPSTADLAAASGGSRDRR